jgi:hypothetical protein
MTPENIGDGERRSIDVGGNTVRQLLLLILVFGGATHIHAGGFDRVQINAGDPQAGPDSVQLERRVAE